MDVSRRRATTARIGRRFSSVIPGSFGTRSLPDLVAAFDVHLGEPDGVVASLLSDGILGRATDVVFQVHSVDPPHVFILRSIELIAEKVAPALGWRGSNLPPQAAAVAPR